MAPQPVSPLLIGACVFGSAATPGMAFHGVGSCASGGREWQTILDPRGLDLFPDEMAWLGARVAVGDTSARLIARLIFAKDRENRPCHAGAAVVVVDQQLEKVGFGGTVVAVERLLEHFVERCVNPTTFQVEFSRVADIWRQLPAMPETQPMRLLSGSKPESYRLPSDWPKYISLPELLRLMTQHPDLRAAEARGFLLRDGTGGTGLTPLDPALLANWYDALYGKAEAASRKLRSRLDETETKLDDVSRRLATAMKQGENLEISEREARRRLETFDVQLAEKNAELRRAFEEKERAAAEARQSAAEARQWRETAARARPAPYQVQGPKPPTSPAWSDDEGSDLSWFGRAMRIAGIASIIFLLGSALGAAGGYKLYERWGAEDAPKKGKPGRQAPRVVTEVDALARCGLKGHAAFLAYADYGCNKDRSQTAFANLQFCRSKVPELAEVAQGLVECEATEKCHDVAELFDANQTENGLAAQKLVSSIKSVLTCVAKGRG